MILLVRELLFADKPSTASEKPTNTPASNKPSPSSTPAAKPSAMDQRAKAKSKTSCCPAAGKCKNSWNFTD
jgi:hypothetical protein